MTLFADLIRSLYFVARGAIDALIGRHRRRYVTAVDIKAPLETVWAAASAHEIVFDGPPRIEITSALRPGTIDIYDGAMRLGEHVVPMAYREIEKKPGQGLVIEILREGSDPAIAPGDDYYVVCTFAEQPGGTRLTMVHELTHTGFLGRVAVPLGAIQNGRRLRDHCEALAGTATEAGGSSRLGAAVLTGALTYVSFSYLTDWTFAAVLLALLIVHEAGHALAMRSVGLPVQGIYFVPFMGGVAVSAAPHRSEGERGFVALMGPGFSLFTTALFLAAAHVTGEALFHQLAFVSAILNGLNLAPVLPLDGGHVVDAALSRSDPDMVAILNVLALIAGVGATVYLGWPILTMLLILAAPLALRSKRPRRVEPISIAGRNWLAAGYMATVAFYAATIAHLMA